MQHYQANGVYVNSDNRVDTTNLLALTVLERLGNPAPTQEQIDLAEMFVLWPPALLKKGNVRSFLTSNTLALRIILRSLNTGVA